MLVSLMLATLLLTQAVELEVVSHGPTQHIVLGEDYSF